MPLFKNEGFTGNLITKVIMRLARKEVVMIMIVYTIRNYRMVNLGLEEDKSRELVFENDFPPTSL